MFFFIWFEFIIDTIFLPSPVCMRVQYKLIHTMCVCVYLFADWLVLTNVSLCIMMLIFCIYLIKFKRMMRPIGVFKGTYFT